MLHSRLRSRAAGGRLAGLLLALAAGALAAPGAQAQPFGIWRVWNPGYPASHAYAVVNHSPDLNPTAAFTFEAWVRITNSTATADCRSIAGKNWEQAWWVGACTDVAGDHPQVLRSYLKGGDSQRNGGIIPRNVWTHVAVVFDGAQRLHYINGEVAATFPETGPLGTSTSPLRIGSDVAYERSPTGGIEEVRLWSVARSTSQLRAFLNRRILTAQPGLVAVWDQDTSRDVVGPHDGDSTGTGLSQGLFAIEAGCAGVADGDTLCLDGRFRIDAHWRTDPPATPVDGHAQVAGSISNSGLFWFFGANNWEVMVKALNGCGLNDRFWVFSAATTNVFYRMEVLDVVGGAQKIYFNYPGPPAPAVTDIDAFATCP